MAEEKFVGDDEEALAMLSLLGGENVPIVVESVATGEDYHGNTDSKRDGGPKDSDAERT